MKKIIFLILLVSLIFVSCVYADDALIIADIDAKIAQHKQDLDTLTKNMEQTSRSLKQAINQGNYLWGAIIGLEDLKASIVQEAVPVEAEVEEVKEEVE